MVFRPATPLSILLLAAFALLLLSVLSAPIIESVEIATFGGVKFGVFGWCSKMKGCSGVSIGYNMDAILAQEGKTDFSLPSNARHSLANLLIVHPIAALMTLVLFILSVLAHLHKPAHSPKYLLALLILCLPTLMVSLLAFLIDILIFLPHVQWGGWIVLAATILIVISGIVMCGMRRQVVGRIARSKRIQENAEMNGQSYFARAAPPPETPDKLPQFASFDVNNSGTTTHHEVERIPLNSRIGSPPVQDDQGFTRSNTLRTEGSDRSNYGPQPRGNGPLGPGHNPMGGNASVGQGPIRNQYSNQTLQSSSSGSSGPYGPPQPMRGLGYAQHPAERAYGGPPPMQGPYDGHQRPPPGRYGPPHPPPPHGPGNYRGGPQPGGFEPRRGPFPGYGPGQGPIRGPPPSHYGPPPPPPPGAYGPFPRNAGPPVMEMGLRGPPPRRQMPPPSPDYDDRDYPAGIDSNYSDERQEFDQTLAPVHSRVIGRALSDDSHTDGNILQQELPTTVSISGSGGGSASGKLAVVNETHPTHDSYIPPQTQWQGEQQHGPANSGKAPENQYPVELPTSSSPQLSATVPARSGSSKSKRASGSYYEDVAPQFDMPHEQASSQQPQQFQPPPQPPLPSTSPHPSILTPGPNNTGLFGPPPNGPWSPPPIPDDGLEDGQRRGRGGRGGGFR